MRVLRENIKEPPERLFCDIGNTVGRDVGDAVPYGRFAAPMP